MRATEGEEGDGEEATSQSCGRTEQEAGECRGGAGGAGGAGGEGAGS